MSEILLLSPYPELSQAARKVLAERQVDFEIVDVPPSRSEQVVKGLDQKAQVIISRGGTAMLARHYTSLPVVEIPVTLSDILGSIGRISGADGGRMVIISTANIIYDPKFISEIRGLSIDFFTSADCFVSCHDWVEERIQSEALAKGGGYDVIIGDALVCAIAAKHGTRSVLIESSRESVGLAVDEAMRIVDTNRRGSRMLIKHRKEILENGWVANYSFRDILGQGRDLDQAVKHARLFAKSDGNVLLEGETGTGKELFAQSIHNESDRVYGPFVSVNCGAISDGLFESELFGYEGGAFTGANKGGKKGLFECAQKGTIFLDEISETSIGSQAKLLRVLQERKLRRVGSEKIVDLDARVICATNKNLLELADAGQFRRDLYYRLGELELCLPPLRDRPQDLPAIAENFLRREAGKINRKLYWKDSGVFAPLAQYDWPGNIRELRNFVIKLVTYSSDGELTGEAIEAVLRSNSREGARRKEGEPAMGAAGKQRQPEGEPTTGATGATGDQRKPELTIGISGDLKAMEKEMFAKLLAHYDGDKKRLCRECGISKPTLWRKLSCK